MSDNQKQIIEDGNAPSVPQAPLATSGVNGGRRRFTVAGIAASGAVLTLASRPVLGQGLCTPGAGMTLSGWTSGNLSVAHANTVATGKSPGYWKTHPASWPAGAPSPSMQFRNFFRSYSGVLQSKVDCQTDTGVVSQYASLLDVLSAEIYNDAFGRSLVCAYLNALDKSPMRPTTDEVMLMSAKKFQPTSTAPYWTENEICCFLGQTFL